MPQIDPVESDEVIPTRADAVVIGGGIAGITVALELAERGMAVAVCEKGLIAAEQSGRNWGWCRKMGRDPRELPLANLSLDLWRQMHQRIGEDTGFRECGISYLCRTDKQMAQRAQWHADHASEHGLSTRIIGPDEAHHLAPGSTIDWKGGLFTPDDGRAEPSIAVPAMARAAQRLGARIFQHCAVRGLQYAGGTVCGVVTEKGEIATDTVVLAGGAWSRRFCHNQGISLPQLTVTNSVMRTAPIETSIEGSLAGDKFAIRKCLDGGYTVAHNLYNTADIMPDSFRLLPHFAPLLKDEWRDFRFRVGKRFFDEAKLKRRWKDDEHSPFEEVRVLDPKPVDGLLDEALQSLKSTLPAFRQVQIKERWAGIIDVMPDVVPVISAVDPVPGLFMSTGYSGHGFGLGPGAGRLMAELVTGETPSVDPKPFAFNRF